MAAAFPSMSEIVAECKEYGEEIRSLSPEDPQLHQRFLSILQVACDRVYQSGRFGPETSVYYLAEPVVTPIEELARHLRRKFKSEGSYLEDEVQRLFDTFFNARLGSPPEREWLEGVLERIQQSYKDNSAYDWHEVEDLNRLRREILRLCKKMREGESETIEGGFDRAFLKLLLEIRDTLKFFFQGSIEADMEALLDAIEKALAYAQYRVRMEEESVETLQTVLTSFVDYFDPFEDTWFGENRRFQLLTKISRLKRARNETSPSPVRAQPAQAAVPAQLAQLEETQDATLGDASPPTPEVSPSQRRRVTFSDDE